VPIVIHWLSALAILVMIGSGLSVANVSDEAARVGILTVHVSVGIVVLLLTLMRFAWWIAVDRRPGHHNGIPGWQARVSHIVHYALYALIVVMLASGIALALLSGVVPGVYTGAVTTLPDFAALPPFIAHSFGAWALIGLVVLHTAAALYHQFWRRDRLMARMGIGAA
jgi:cytochrome b561